MVLTSLGPPEPHRMAQQDTWTKKDLTGIEELSRSEIELLFRQADQFLPALAPGKGLDLMKGRTVVNLFLEPSTRTRTAFEISAKKLGAEVVSINTTASSLVKGETLRDTAENIRAMGVDAIVMRHSSAGSARYLGSVLDISVINAGDGAHEHPTQGLLDVFAIRHYKKDFTNLRVAIVGDILHSRVARSTSTILKKLGVEVAYLGPGSLVPRTGPENIRRFTDYNEAMAWSPDVVYLLRVQMERQDVQYFPSLREYHKLYGISDARLDEIRKRGLYIMHPGPVNRGVELCDAVMDYERSLINDQVENGIAVRMAVLYWLKPGSMA